MDAETYRRAVAVENVKARVQPKGRAVEQDELAALFRVCAEDESPAGRRDAALFAVLYGAGLRRAELCGLDLADFDALDCALTVRAGKGRRDRTVYLPAEVCRHLCAWVEVREGEPGPLFNPVRSTGEVPITRLRGETVWYILKRRMKQAGLEGITPHAFRRAYVSRAAGGRSGPPHRAGARRACRRGNDRQVRPAGSRSTEDSGWRPALPGSALSQAAVSCDNAQAMAYVVGLDWAGPNAWASCRLAVDEPKRPEVHRLGAGAESLLDLLRDAERVVVDAPIGLPECERTAQLRPCDRGAREWVGPDLGQSIQPVPTQRELEFWREAPPEQRRRGHLRGLLPTISSAAYLRENRIAVIESHPELVFAALSGRPLARALKKTTLWGTSARLELLRRAGVDLLHASPPQDPIRADDVLDAGAMALVALGWWRKGAKLEVIRSVDGEPVRLAQDGLEYLMALPEAAIDSRGKEAVRDLDDGF